MSARSPGTIVHTREYLERAHDAQMNGAEKRERELRAEVADLKARLDHTRAILVSFGRGAETWKDAQAIVDRAVAATYGTLQPETP